MLYTVKFVDGMPLTRFGRVLERHNAPVPSQTLVRWVIGGGKIAAASAQPDARHPAGLLPDLV